MSVSFQVVPSVADAFAAVVTEELTARVAHGRRYPFFLSGGPTARLAYQALAGATTAYARDSDEAGADEGGPDSGDARRAEPVWPDVEIYWGDERCVPPDDPDSNYRLGREALLDRIGETGPVHPMYESGPPEQAAAAYQELLAGLPTLGIVHLGLGPDGHCASLFPDSAGAAITDAATLVVANTDPHGANPHPRLTLTLPAIARADLVIFTVSGASKRDALARVRAGDDLPAARVTAPRVLWLVDEDALGAPDAS